MTFSGSTKVAILDDYQHVAFTMADWSSLHDKITVDVYDETLADEDALVRRLEPYPVICAMRERTKFPASVLDRLPNLKLIATTGMWNAGIDVAHAKKKGITVSGTGGAGNSTTEHIWALLLATARHIALDDAEVKARRQLWQTTIPIGLSGKTLGLVGVGKLGAATAKVSMYRVVGIQRHANKKPLDSEGVQSGGDWVVSSPHARASCRRWCHLHRDEGGVIQTQRYCVYPSCPVRIDSSSGHCCRPRTSQTNGHLHQYIARSNCRRRCPG